MSVVLLATVFFDYLSFVFTLLENPLLDTNRYLKYLDDFSVYGLLPEKSTDGVRMRPWEEWQDPLFDFLQSLSRHPSMLRK